MSSKKPVVGLIFLVGLGIATAAAGYYTFLLPEKQTSCPATPQTYTVNATGYQWGWIINGTDATLNGWSICHGSTVTFRVTGSWDHNPDIGGSFNQHGFIISVIMSNFVTINQGQVAEFTVTFDRPGTYVLQCTIFCGQSQQWGSHGTMSATITVT